MAPTKEQGGKAKATKGKKTVGKQNQAEVVDKIRKFLFEMLELGTETVPVADVVNAAGYQRHDSTGYRLAEKTLIKELKHVEKAPGKTLKLTEIGLKHMGGLPQEAEPTSNAEKKEQVKAKIVKLGKGKCPEKAVDAILGVLSDGKQHSISELLEAAGYKRADSTGYREVMKLLKRFEWVEKCGKDFRFTDNMFPFGRGSA